MHVYAMHARCPYHIECGRACHIGTYAARTLCNDPSMYASICAFCFYQQLWSHRALQAPHAPSAHPCGRLDAAQGARSGPPHRPIEIGRDVGRRVRRLAHHDVPPRQHQDAACHVKQIPYMALLAQGQAFQAGHQACSAELSESREEAAFPSGLPGVHVSDLAVNSPGVRAACQGGRRYRSIEHCQGGAATVALSAGAHWLRDTYELHRDRERNINTIATQRIANR